MKKRLFGFFIYCCSIFFLSLGICTSIVIVGLIFLQITGGIK